jgi:hypothetical protein
MSDTTTTTALPITIPNDATTNIPMTFADQFGRPVPTPTGGNVAVSDATVGVASLSADGTTLMVGPVTDGLMGTFNVIYTLGANPPATFSFVLAAPMLEIGINPTSVTYTPK